jgi:hypothetical protein
LLVVVEPHEVRPYEEDPDDPDWGKRDFWGSESPLVLEVSIPDRDPNEDYEEQIRLAKFLSSRLGCRTICDGSGHGPSIAPFWSIVWEDGIAYLADDCETGRGGPVYIVRPIEIEGAD